VPGVPVTSMFGTFREPYFSISIVESIITLTNSQKVHSETSIRKSSPLAIESILRIGSVLNCLQHLCIYDSSFWMLFERLYNIHPLTELKEKERFLA